MRKRNRGKFKQLYQVGGEVETDMSPGVGNTESDDLDKMRPVMGAPLPSPRAKQGVMGKISPPREKLSPQTYSGEMAARKRMQKMPATSPLGPITGGLKSSGQQPQGQQPQGGPISLGDRWMGEVWQQLTPEETPMGGSGGLGGIGYANGGSVDEAMAVYNQTMQDLEAGGVGGYAHGGMVDQSRDIAAMGRNGDSMLMHVNPAELQGLQSLLGPVSVNPNTGNPEAFPWIIPLLGLAAGTLIGGGISDWEAGPMIGGALAGLTLGAGAGALAAPAVAGTVAGTTAAGSTAAGSTAAGTGPAWLGALLGTTAPGAPQVPLLAAGASTAAPVITSALGGAGIGSGALAPGAAVLAPGYGGGLTAGQVASAGFGPSAGGIYAAPSVPSGGIGSALKNPLAKQGLGMLSKPPQQRQKVAPPPPPPPKPRKPWQAPKLPGQNPMDEFLKKRRRLPGSRSIMGGGIGGLA